MAGSSNSAYRVVPPPAPPLDVMIVVAGWPNISLTIVVDDDECAVARADEESEEDRECGRSKIAPATADDDEAGNR